MSETGRARGGQAGWVNCMAVIPLKFMKHRVKILWSFFILIVFMFSNTKGENISESFEDSVSQRKFFSTFTIGVVEYSSLCFSYQIDSENSIGVKFQNILIESGGGGGATGFLMSGAFGVGIVGAHYFSGRLFNIGYFFYEDIPEINKFKVALKGLKKSIKEVQKIPIDKRTYEEW